MRKDMAARMSLQEFRLGTKVFEMEQVEREEPDHIWPDEIPGSTSFCNWMRTESEALKLTEREDMFEIERGIELPRVQSENRGVSTEIRDTMKAMQPGESFFIPLSTSKSNERDNKMVTASMYYASKARLGDQEHIYVSRYVKGPKPGYRVWKMVKPESKPAPTSAEGS